MVFSEGSLGFSNLSLLDIVPDIVSRLQVISTRIPKFEAVNPLLIGF
jgi:hypothetical protein